MTARAKKRPLYRRVWVRIRNSRPRRWRRGWQRIPTLREDFVRHARWALSIEPTFHYRQSRPIDVNAIRDRDHVIVTDCSGSGVMLCKAAGLPDPSGGKFDGGRTHPTYTGTIRSHLPRRSRVGDCLPGDPIVYGGGTGAHVVWVIEPGADPLVWSHGQENGPRLYRHSQQVAAHGSTFTCHDVTKG